ncbi:MULTISPECIES: hypothetical protein [unclassified Isoptericola]|uniref:hypothetical protein n=1 Tax=unclassified Isoptericola TaxID=2623355 RepID=UPI0036510ABD
MNLSEIEAYLQSATADLPGLESQVTIRDHDVVARLWRPGEPERWAQVRTPGDDMFWLSVDGRFGTAIPTLSPDDDEITESLDELLAVARAYLEGRVERHGRRFPTLTVTTPDGTEVLQRALTTNLRDLFTRRSPGGLEDHA